MDKIYKVKDQSRFVKHLATYENGILTTGGLYKVEELEEMSGIVIGITYNAAACTELPVDWHNIRFLDDNDKRQFIKEVLFGSDKPYLMEDGTLSQEVTDGRWHTAIGGKDE